MSPILGTLASQFSGKSFGSYESIASATGTGSSGTITFSSIPSTYSHLQIRCTSQLSSTSNYAIFRPNNDSSTANYTFHSQYGDGATVTADGYITGLDGAYSVNGTSSTQNASTVGVGIVNIHDYTSTTKYKTFSSIAGYDNNGSGIIFLISSLWKNTSAISSLTIVAQGGNFTTGTTFALYGIK
jgi:hypothetical protein